GRRPAAKAIVRRCGRHARDSFGRRAEIRPFARGLASRFEAVERAALAQRRTEAARLQFVVGHRAFRRAAGRHRAIYVPGTSPFRLARHTDRSPRGHRPAIRPVFVRRGALRTAHWCDALWIARWVQPRTARRRAIAAAAKTGRETD